jgi:Zn-dependent protease with chaperone function
MTDPSPVPIPITTPAALAFAHEGEWLFLGLQLVAMAVPLAWLLTRWGAGLRSWIDKLTGGRRWATLTLFAWVFLLVQTAASLPLLYQRDVVRWRQWTAFGFPPPTPAAWLAGQAGHLLVLTLLAAALLWIPFRLIERRPRTWPVLVTCLALPALSAVLVLWQTVLMPMTIRFQPIRDPALAAQIHTLAQRCGAGQVPILVGGNDVTVVGLGPTTRILVAPWSLKTETQRQLLASIAHELKHDLMGDNWLALGVVGVLMLAGSLLVQVLGGLVIRLWGPRLGLASLYDPAALPLMALILVLGWSIAGLPLFNAVQKHAEHDADRFALEATHDNRAFSEWQAMAGGLPWKMNEEDWVTSVFLDNHPSQADRVRFGNSYRPWAHGQRGAYDGVCNPAA